MEPVLIQKHKNQLHKGACISTEWCRHNGQDILFSLGKDSILYKWKSDLSSQEPLLDFQKSPPTPSSTQPVQLAILPTPSSPQLIIAFSDGSIHLFNIYGKVEKSIPNAHQQSITSLSISSDNLYFASSSLDSQVKIWSVNGLLRSVLSSSTSDPIYQCSFYSDNNAIAYTSTSSLIVESVTTSRRYFSSSQKIGQCLLLSVNPITNALLCGYEDGSVCIFEETGDCIFSGDIISTGVTVIATSGNQFLVGGYKQLKLFTFDNKNIQVHSSLLSSLTSSPTKFAWNKDGTRLAIGFMDGAVMVCDLECQEFKNQELLIQKVPGENKIALRHFYKNLTAEIPFNEKITAIYANHQHFVIQSSSNLVAYSLFPCSELSKAAYEEGLLWVALESNYMALVYEDKVLVRSFDNTLLSVINLTLHETFLQKKKWNPHLFSTSKDVIAICNNQHNQILIFDIHNGTLSYTHNIKSSLSSLSSSSSSPVSLSSPSSPVAKKILLSSYGYDRHIAYVNDQKELYISHIALDQAFLLCDNVSSIMFSKHSHQLCAVYNNHYVKQFFCYDSNVPFLNERATINVDILQWKIGRGVANKAPLSLPNHFVYGLGYRILGINDSLITIENSLSNNEVIHIENVPALSQFYKCVLGSKWSECVKICRFMKQKILWNILFSISLAKGEYKISKMCCMEIDQPICLLESIERIHNNPSNKETEVTLLNNNIQEYINTLIENNNASNSNIYRAVKVLIRYHMWNQALALSIRQRSHIDTVLYYRKEFLEALGKSEWLPTFQKLFDEIQIQDSTIIKKINLAKQQEKLSSSTKDIN